jgi:hypothetical protein
LRPRPQPILEEAIGAVLAAVLLYSGAVLLGYIGTPAIGSLMVIFGLIAVIGGTTLTQNRRQLGVVFGGGLLLAVVGGSTDPVAGRVFSWVGGIISVYIVVVLIFFVRSAFAGRRVSRRPEPSGGHE